MEPRCNYCGRKVFKNRSQKYQLCSNNCKKLYSKKDDIFSFENRIKEIVKQKPIQILQIQKEFNKNEKFMVISAIRRLIYFHNFYTSQSNKEITQKSIIFRVKK
jgi:uncharacterized protein YcbK (DUF882 family)